MNHFRLSNDEWAFVSKIIASLCAVYGVPYTETDDILQNVRLAFLQSDYVGRYDPGKGSMDSYLRPRVRGAFIDAIRKDMGREENLRRKGRHKMWPCDVMSYDVDIPSSDKNYILGYDERTLDKIIAKEDKIIAKNLVDEILTRLPDNYAEVLRLYYLEGATLAEIGRLRNVCESRISQICKKARARVKEEYTLLGISVQISNINEDLN